MRSCLCWNCGRLCECNKEFPNGRPKRRSECADYKEAPPEPKRITHREMANELGWSMRKVEQLIASRNGVKYLMKALARKNIILTYDIKKNRIYFYKEIIDNDR